MAVDAKGLKAFPGDTPLGSPQLRDRYQGSMHFYSCGQWWVDLLKCGDRVYVHVWYVW